MKKSGVSLLGVVGWMQECLFGLGSFGLEVGWGFDVNSQGKVWQANDIRWKGGFCIRELKRLWTLSRMLGKKSEFIFNTTSCDEMIWSMLRVAGMGSD